MSHHARLYRHLRTAHLERALLSPEIPIFYREEQYDFDSSIAHRLILVKGTPLGIAFQLFRSDISQLEINEPLYPPALPLTCAAILALKLRGFLTGRRCSFVSYAIANMDAAEAISSGVRRRVVKLLGAFVWKSLDRVAFGTSGAEMTYSARFGRMPATYRVIEALPAPRPDVLESPAAAVLFVGAFERRKGILDLLDAWPAVVRAEPEAVLTVVGKGPLEGEVRSAVASMTSVRLYVDPPRVELMGIYERNSVCVLPSKRDGQWREQLGLPIIEALSAGLLVVTTDETGLAEWLRVNGHRVLVQPDPAAIARAVVAAIQDAGSKRSRVQVLPAEDGREAADQWLTSGYREPV